MEGGRAARQKRERPEAGTPGGGVRGGEAEGGGRGWRQEEGGEGAEAHIKSRTFTRGEETSYASDNVGGTCFHKFRPHCQLRKSLFQNLFKKSRI